MIRHVCSPMQLIMPYLLCRRTKQLSQDQDIPREALIRRLTYHVQCG